jgi:hypothetical protein
MARRVTGGAEEGSGGCGLRRHHRPSLSLSAQASGGRRVLPVEGAADPVGRARRAVGGAEDIGDGGRLSLSLVPSGEPSKEKGGGY